MYSILQKQLSFFFAILVIATFALHTIQVEHTHYSAVSDAEHSIHDHAHTGDAQQSDSSESLATQMHMADKKVFTVAVTLTVLFFALIAVSQFSYRTIERLLSVQMKTFRKKRLDILFSHIRLLLSAGILNPKSY